VNDGPTADAGADQSVTYGDTVQLDGSGSWDVEGDALTYGWVQNGGSPALTLSDSSAVTPTFLATSSGVFTFTLTVTDAGGLNNSDQVVVTVGAVAQTNYYFPIVFKNFILVPTRKMTR